MIYIAISLEDLLVLALFVLVVVTLLVHRKRYFIRENRLDNRSLH